jgi:hypothetical protein
MRQVANKQGKRGWCWVTGNKSVTVFKIANSRGQKILESFLPDMQLIIFLTKKNGRYA